MIVFTTSSDERESGQQRCVEPLSDLGHSEVGVLAWDEELAKRQPEWDLCIAVHPEAPMRILLGQSYWTRQLCYPGHGLAPGRALARFCVILGTGSHLGEHWPYLRACVESFLPGWCL